MLIIKSCIILFFVFSWYFAFKLFRNHKDQFGDDSTLMIESLRDVVGEKINEIILSITVFISGVFLFIDFFAAMNGYIYFVNTEQWFLYLTCSFFILQLYQMIVEGKLVIRLLNSPYGFVNTFNRYTRLKKDSIIKYITVYGWAFLSAYLLIHVI